MVDIKNISDIEGLTSTDILNLFKETRAFKLLSTKAWNNRTDIFVNPIAFLRDISNDITDSISSAFDTDYWLLILGGSGAGKSTLSMAIYKHIMKNLGYTDEQIKNSIYLDFCYLPYDYLGRIMLHEKQIQEKGKSFPHPIILDDAYHLFGVFNRGITGTTRKLLDKIWEIGEYRLAHIVNNQFSLQLAQRAIMRMHSLIILWKEPISIGSNETPNMEETYLSYVKNLLNKSQETNSNNKDVDFLWGAFYGKDKAYKVMGYITKNQGNIGEVDILAKFTPDYIFPMLLTLHEISDLRKAYKDIKDCSLSIIDYYRNAEKLKIKGSHKCLFLRILIELNKNFDRITDKVDSKGFYKVNPPLDFKIRNKKDFDALQDIGDIHLEPPIKQTRKIYKDSTYIKETYSESPKIKIYSINSYIYYFLKNCHETLEKRSQLYERLY
ncbi:putative AAA family ATPase [Candidatus Nanobsidianus stetteri]|uniref:Putative AAA family ATPase n=1 Tax=Nanobsidianus stetteri TaxID=1294122 RepID=R1E542_NANST|nr:putative AAA family ATPase [Candidatus Nanobsidianus stetteri]